jgi:hypothetical protein
MSGVFRNIDPPSPHRPASVYPPPLVRGEDTLARGRGVGGHCSVLYICNYFVGFWHGQKFGGFSMEYFVELKPLFKGDSLTKLCVACLSAPVPLSACTPKARPSLIAGLSAPAQQEGQHTVQYCKWILMHNIWN